MAVSTEPFKYHKKPESFLIGFKRQVDYFASIGISKVIIWGFLRDAHGGIKSAVELCKYAADKGVAIIPGVGLCSYGGFYFEGDHEFNIQSYLRQHPERASVAIHCVNKREEAPTLDPTLKANQEWWLKGLEWMLETFEIGGINFEMGDHLANISQTAQQARDNLNIVCQESIKDIIIATSPIIKRGLEIIPDGLFINSTYNGYGKTDGFPEMPYIAKLPDKTVWQYTADRTADIEGFPKALQGGELQRIYSYLHWFSSANNSADKDYVPEIARTFPGFHELNMEFAGGYGEISAINNPLADRNYRAMAAWAGDASMTLEKFQKGLQK
jgi:hypothetical protein